MTTNVEIFQAGDRRVQPRGCRRGAAVFDEDIEVYDPDLPGGDLPRARRRQRRARPDADQRLRATSRSRTSSCIPAGDRVVGLIHTLQTRASGGDRGRDPRRAHCDLPRRQGHLLAPLPGPGRGAPGRRPRPRAGEQRHAGHPPSPLIGFPCGEHSVSRRARVRARRSRADRGRVGRRALRCRSAPRRAVIGDSLRPGLAADRLPGASGDPPSAQEFAAARGDVSFAVIDDSIGLRGFDPRRRFSSASVSKALLLAAELRRLDSERLPLDGETRTCSSR